MTTQTIRPSNAPRPDIRCNVGDVMVANLAIHVVFFFERRLDARALADAFALALNKFPIFAGRMGLTNGRMRIRYRGQGVPFTTVSSLRSCQDAIRSTSHDEGRWLVDPVNGVAARWGWGHLCKVRVTHLADDATAIGFSWHHCVGDMQSAMHFMTAWAAAAADQPLAEPLIVEDRAAYLDEHLPTDGAREPGVRCLTLAEFARSALYLARDARKQRTVRMYFSEDEIARMRDAYGSRVRLSANDVSCAHVAEALMRGDPAADRRTLAIAVDARRRCGLDPLLIGNVITTLNFDLRRGEAAGSIAERIRHDVDNFAAEHCDLRINQRFIDAAGAFRAARCVSTAFNPVQWNPVVSNWSGFGVYRLQFEGTTPAYFTPVLRPPVAGLGALVDGPGGRGVVFLMSLPPSTFEAMSSPAMRDHVRRFRRSSARGQPPGI